jgi:signal transduction histidine kinase
MTGGERLVLLVCADVMQAKKYVAALSSADDHLLVRQADTLTQAESMLGGFTPQVILFDESALPTQTKAARVVASLVEHAPVVVAVNAENEEAFAFLIGSGAADVVARTGHFASVAAGMVDRRLRLAEQAASDIGLFEPGVDFGELLRHEMNNPLTGILGNAELLLSRRDRLPPQAIAQLETIASLAMRLRETVRHLSDRWESSRHHAHSV